ncbi:MAG: hypothetical protein KKD63_06035 [Proteobacteria bacterium]|nr:hypothetical protein [Pseudomonadota bacterium]MDP2107346.1 hypothetical protein [Desulfobulbaceae bacterium]
MSSMRTRQQQCRALKISANITLPGDGLQGRILFHQEQQPLLLKDLLLKWNR